MLKAVQDSVCNQLLRTRPLASTQDGQLRLHGRLLAKTNVASQHNQSSHPALFDGYALYLIVPKKRYRYAVDRNRVKRVVRAQLACVLGEKAQHYQWVFRTPASKAKGVCLKPHTKAFTTAVTELIQQAQSKVSTLNPPTLSSALAESISAV